MAVLVVACTCLRALGGGIWMVGQATAILQTALLGIAGSLVVLFIGHITWARRLTNPTARTVCAAATIAVMALLITPTSLTLQGQNAPTLIGRFVVACASFVAIAVVLDTRSRWRMTATALLSDQRQLRASRDSYARVLAEIRQDTALDTYHQIRNGLTGCVETLLALASSPTLEPPSLRGAATQLRACATTLVRELSHRLDRPPSVATPLALTPSAPPHIRLDSIAVFQRALCHPFHPLVVSSILFCAAALVGGTQRGAAGVVSALVVAAVIGFGIALCKHLLLPTITNLHAIIRIALVAASLIMASVAASLLLEVVRDPIISGRPLALALALGTCLTSGIVAVGIAYSHAQRDYLAQLRNTNAALKFENDQLANDEVAIRRQMSMLLHGELQGRLGWSAFQLEAIADQIDAGEFMDGPEPRKSLRECAAALTAAGEELIRLGSANPPPERSLVAELDELISQWQGLVDVDITCSVETRRHLESAPALAGAVRQVVAEAIANAARHGGANCVSVAFHLSSDTLRITITDDGAGPEPRAPEGLGLRMMQRTATDVSLRTGPLGGGELVVELPTAVANTASTRMAHL